MEKWKCPTIIGMGLIAASALLYFFHYLLFHNANHILLYLTSDIAFVPIELLLITVIIYKLLEHREKKKKLEKLNMIIPLFFSEVGTDLLTTFSNFDRNLAQIKEDLLVKEIWGEKEFDAVFRKLKSYNYQVTIKKINLEKLSIRLKSKKEFLCKLLTNTALMEHENFTQLLIALFHLQEEFVSRINIKKLSEEDQDHITSDIVRAYKLLICQWIEYMKYLKREYPYLFEFALNTNPFKKM